MLTVLAIAQAGCTMVGVPGSYAPPATRPAEAVPEEPDSGASAVRPAPRIQPALGPLASPAARPLPGSAREVRALWVVRTTLGSPERVLEMVEETSRAGFNTLFVQVRGRGDAYYLGGSEPRAEALAGQAPHFDPLALVIREAHARGMAVHAWINTFLVWGPVGLPDSPEHLVHSRPDLLAVPRELARELHARNPWDGGYVATLQRHARANSNAVEGLYASPAHPEVQERILDVWRDLALRYDLDGMHFDYVRYPSPDWDYSAVTLRAFRDWAAVGVSARMAAELDRVAERDALAWPDGLPNEWRQYRRTVVTDLVRLVTAEVRRIRPHILVSAAVVPDPSDAVELRLQDWPTWVREGHLDLVAPMAYTADHGSFRELVSGAIRVAGEDRVWAGIGAWRNSFRGTVQQIETARSLGLRGFSLFSYDWAAGQRADGVDQSFLEGVGTIAFPP